jgi:hypothetical protein
VASSFSPARSTSIGQTAWNIGAAIVRNLYGGVSSAKTGKEDVYTPSRAL